MFATHAIEIVAVMVRLEPSIELQGRHYSKEGRLSTVVSVNRIENDCLASCSLC